MVFRFRGIAGYVVAVVRMSSYAISRRGRG